MIGYIAQMSIPEASTPERERGVAVDDQLRLRRSFGGDRVAEVEVLLRPRPACLEQFDVLRDHPLVLLGEDGANLLAREPHVQAVEVAEDAEREHVLATARVRDELAALDLHRDLDHAEALVDELLDRLGIRGGDRRIAVLAPHALEHDRRARLELVRPDATEQDLLVERNREIRFITAVGDAALSDADAHATRARDAARRRLDLRRDDLHGPDPVSHLGGDRAERLAAPLRALTRVADHLDDVLADDHRRFSIGVAHAVTRA